MNRYNFQQTGGFPLETDTLNNMQVAYSLFNALGEIWGDKTIVTGCNEVAGVVSNGAVYLNGELLEFRGGSIQTHIRLIEISTSKEFEDGSFKEVFYERYVTFSSGPDEIPWSEFTRVIPLKEIVKRLVHPKFVVPFKGYVNEIPLGWVLCNGENGTDDMSGVFIAGYSPNDTDYNEIGKTGGAKTVTLTEAQMPRHSHPNDWQMYNEGGSETGHMAGGGNETRNEKRFNLDTGFRGGSQAHENRPPYYTLAYIMFIGY